MFRKLDIQVNLSTIISSIYISIDIPLQLCMSELFKTTLSHRPPVFYWLFLPFNFPNDQKKKKWFLSNSSTMLGKSKILVVDNLIKTHKCVLYLWVGDLGQYNYCHLLPVSNRNVFNLFSKTRFILCPK